MKQYQPPGNILLKDDKSPLYIVVTKEQYPKVLIRRRVLLSDGGLQLKAIYGPFPSAAKTRSVYKFARQLFPFCNATNWERQNHRACFYYHLGMCPGVCLGLVSLKKYNHSIDRLMLFLEGSHQQLIQDLNASIAKAITDQNFELAALYKRQITDLNSLSEWRSLPDEIRVPDLLNHSTTTGLQNLEHFLMSKLNVSEPLKLHRLEMYDCATLGGLDTTVSMVVFDNQGKNSAAYRHFHIKGEDALDDFSSLSQALKRRFNHKEWPFPDIVVVDGGTPQVRAVMPFVPETVLVLGLAKKPDRLVYRDPELKKYALINLRPGDKDTVLLQEMRDEAHRFARRLHFITQNKRLLSSSSS